MVIISLIDDYLGKLRFRNVKEFNYIVLYRMNFNFLYIIKLMYFLMVCESKKLKYNLEML